MSVKSSKKKTVKEPKEHKEPIEDALQKEPLNVVSKVKKKDEKAKIKKRKNFNHAESSSSSEAKSQSETEDDSSESETDSDTVEDEDGELVTPAVDAQILTTLAKIRAKDPAIYEPGQAFYREEDLKEAQEKWMENRKKAQQEKPLSFQEYQRKRILEGAHLTSSEEEENEVPPLTHAQEQELLKQQFKAAFGSFDQESYKGDDDLLKLRPKSTQEIEREEEEYRNFLLESLAKNNDALQHMNNWLEFRRETDPKAASNLTSKNLDPNEAFLIDYVLNRGWIDKERKTLPSYDAIVAEEVDDEESLEKADAFEAEFNFRYEQPGAAQIQTFARNQDGSMRRTESKRKAEREAKKARKAEEKIRQQEELKRLKNQKKQELAEKFRKIQAISGNESIGVEDIDLESDFDPEAHDKRMASLFDQSFYDQDDAGLGVALENDSEDDEIHFKSVKKSKSKTLSNIIERNDEESGEKSSKRNRKKLSDYLNEYYQLDYEDMIDDIPCRFKYTKVQPTTFGLDVKEIIEADDADLNSFVSLKKLAPYRPVEKQQEDIQKYSKKKRVYMFRSNLWEKKKAAKSNYK